MTYSLYLGNGKTHDRITSSQIVAMLDSSNPLQAAHIRAVQNLEADGCRYSYQDSDVLSAARNVAINGRTEAYTHELGWVAAMTSSAA